MASILLVSAFDAHAETDAPTHSVVVLSADGVSLSLGDRRVANRAPATAEIRFGWNALRSLKIVFEGGLAGYAYPELVAALTAGARMHPVPEVRGLRAWFVRVGGQVLVARGSDVAVAAETGVAVEHARLIGWLGLGGDYYMIHPRVVAQVRVGVGVQF